MQIVDLAVQPIQIRTQAAAMLVEAFPDEDGWPTLELGLAEIDWVAKDGFVLAAVDGGQGSPRLLAPTTSMA